MVGRINIIMVIELLVLREKQIGMRSGCRRKKKLSHKFSPTAGWIGMAADPVQQQRSTARL